RSASASVEKLRPPTSRATTCSPRPRVASIASPSFATARLRSPLRPRAARGISVMLSSKSRGRRLRYSSVPSRPQPGLRPPAAINLSRMPPSPSGFVGTARAEPPQRFEVVELARGLLHHVHDDVAEVEQDPFGLIGAFHAIDRMAGFLRLLHHFIGHRLDV